MLDIGRWVFAEACRQLALWRNEYPDLPMVVRVNMSPIEFSASDLVGFVENCLVANDVPAERLCIEITEYAVVDEPEKDRRDPARLPEDRGRGGYRRLWDRFRVDDRTEAPARGHAEAGHELRRGHHH